MTGLSSLKQLVVVQILSTILTDVTTRFRTSCAGSWVRRTRELLLNWWIPLSLEGGKMMRVLRVVDKRSDEGMRAISRYRDEEAAREEIQSENGGRIQDLQDLQLVLRGAQKILEKGRQAIAL